MSRTNQPIAINPEHPVYYAELLSTLSTAPRPANWRLSDEPFCPDVPGIHDPLAQRLRTLLDVVTDISLCHRGNVSATMARLREGEGTLETQLYINHEDEAARRCFQHLVQSIFAMLSQVPCKSATIDDSPKDIGSEFTHNLIEISRAIHNYSFEIFAHRVNKRKHKLSDIQTYIAQDQTHFELEHRRTLLAFLQHVDLIIKTVADAQATKQLSNVEIGMFLKKSTRAGRNATFFLRMLLPTIGRCRYLAR